MNQLSKYVHALLAARRKSVQVPVVRQLALFESGAACLAMVLSHYGRKSTVSECRLKTGGDRSGLSVPKLARAAREYDLEAQGQSVTVADLARLSLPAILEWTSSHFVVLEDAGIHHITIVDPAVGRIRIPSVEAERSFSGKALTVIPSPQFARHQSVRPAVPGLPQYIRRHLGERTLLRSLMQISLLSGVLQLWGLALPVMTRVLIDDVLPRASLGLWVTVAAVVLIVPIAQYVTALVRSKSLAVLRRYLDQVLTANFVHHLLSCPVRFFHIRTQGDLLLRVHSNAALRDLLANHSMSMALDCLFVIVYLLALCAQDMNFAALTVITLMAQTAIIACTRQRTSEFLKREIATRANEHSCLAEALRGIDTIKALSAEKVTFERWSTLFGKALDAVFESGMYHARRDSLIAATRVLAPLLFTWYGAIRVSDGAITIGTMVSLVALGSAVLTPITTVLGAWDQLQNLGAHFERISDVLAEPGEFDYTECPMKRPEAAKIQLEDLWYRFDSGGPDIIRGIALEIAAGERVAIVGPSGCGKTTLARLILGLIEPSRGRVLCDSVPIDAKNRRTVRKRMCMVPQESVLFTATIQENICLANRATSLDTAITAARIACADAFIDAMPMKYDTVLSESGSSLSGGERQRLAIARAVAARPSVLVLDEASSQLDYASERRIHEKLAELGCTVITIAHRLNAVYDADRILYLSDGRIVESGTHEELVAARGSYFAMVRAHLVGRSQDEMDSGTPMLARTDQVHRAQETVGKLSAQA